MLSLYNVIGMHMNSGLNIWYRVNNVGTLQWGRAVLVFSALVTSSSLCRLRLHEIPPPH